MRGCGLLHAERMVGHSEKDPSDSTWNGPHIVHWPCKAALRTDPERQFVRPAPPGAAVSPVGEPTTQAPKVAHTAPVAERPPSSCALLESREHDHEDRGMENGTPAAGGYTMFRLPPA